MTRHILLTTDLSKNAVRAFAPTCALARSTGAKITLMHVVQTLTNVDVGGAHALPPAIGDPERDKATALEALEKQSEQLASDIEVALVVLVSPSVSEAIAEWADSNDVDLVALSTHGRSGFRRMVLGSAAESILRNAHVPVLCFPPPKDAEGE